MNKLTNFWITEQELAMLIDRFKKEPFLFEHEYKLLQRLEHAKDSLQKDKNGV